MSSPLGSRTVCRDAFTRGKSKADQPPDLIVFQVKYSKNPHLKNEREVIEDLIKTERDKVSKLIQSGARSYYLLTNVAGTSHLQTGSIDRFNETLSASFGVPCFCWWRDDLARRIDANSSIKWSFPNIMRAEDLLQILIEGRGLKEATRLSRVLNSYMAYQYERESKLKFKQIDLQKELSDQFVDVPALIVIPDGDRDKTLWARRIGVQVAKDLLDADAIRRSSGGENSERFLGQAPGALQYFGEDGYFESLSKGRFGRCAWTR